MAKEKKTDEVKAVDELNDELLEATEAISDDATAIDAVEKEVDAIIDEDTKTEVKKAGKHSAKAIREAEAEEARIAAKDSDLEPAKVIKAPRRQEPNPLHQHGKKYRSVMDKVEAGRVYTLEEALVLAKDTSTTKFDSSVEMHVGLGVDPRQADQMVRATVTLPSGTGRTIRIAVLAPEAKHKDALAAGADRVGEADLLADIEKNKLDFDLLIATPDMMSKLGKAAKILGPKGLMPNPKSGSVTPDVAAAVKASKGGKVEFRIDKQAIIHMAIGKVSFSQADLLANAKTVVSAIMNAKPSSTKGTYVKSMSVTSTMGPGIKVDVTQAIALSNKKS